MQNILRNRVVMIIFAAVAANIGMWLIFLLLPDVSLPFVLKRTAEPAISILGEKRSLLVMPLLGILIIFINLAMMQWTKINTQGKNILLGSALFGNMILLLSLFLLYLANT